MLFPLVNPIRLAEEYAMLDVMSNGRLVAGFMRGIPHEYVANMSPDESYERMEEAIDLIKNVGVNLSHLVGKVNFINIEQFYLAKPVKNLCPEL